MSRNKSNFIVNPETNRTIRVGGRSWLKLVKKGVVGRGDYLPPNCAYRLKEEEYENEQEKIEALETERERIIKNKEAPVGQKPVIYKKNQIVYQSDHKTTAADSARLTSDAALDVIDQIQNGDIDIPTDMDRDEARDYLQGLIFSQMLTKKKKFKNNRLEPKIVKDPRDLRRPLTQKILTKAKSARQVDSNHPQYRYGTGKRQILKKPSNIRKITRLSNKKKKKEQVYFIEKPEDIDDGAHEYANQDQYESETKYANQDESETEYEYVDVEVDDDDVEDGAHEYANQDNYQYEYE